MSEELRDITNSKYLSAYASWATAISGIGSTPTVLRVNETPTISANVTLPATLKIVIEGASGLSINSGIIVNGRVPDDAPQRQWIFGAGEFRPTKQAGGGQFYGCWWIPDGSASAQTITQAMWNGMRYALYNNQGGKIILPIGSYNQTYVPLIEIGSIVGPGASPNLAGTILTQQTSNASCFKVIPIARNVTFDNLVLYPNGSGSGVLCEGEFGVDTQNIDGVKMDRVTVQGGRSAFRMHDINTSANAYQIMNVHISDSCNFLDQTFACFEANTSNSKGTCAAQLRPAAGAWGVWYDNCGKWEFDNHIIGINPAGGIYSKNFTFTSGDVTTGTDIVAKASSGQVSGTPGYLTNSGGGLPAPLAAATKYFLSVSGNNHKFHTTAAAALAGTGAIDITTAGTGTQTWHSTIPNDTGQPAGSYYLKNYIPAGFVIKNKYTESLPWEVVLEDIYDYSSQLILINPLAQGQYKFINTKTNLVILGGQLLPGSFHDDATSHVKIWNFGAVSRTYGKTEFGGTHLDYGGYAVPSPWNLENFIGDSEFIVDTVTGKGFVTVGVPLNNTNLTGTTLADILEIHGTGAGLKIYNRDTDASNVQLYSPTALALHFYAGGGDILRLTTTNIEAILPFKGRKTPRVQVVASASTPTPDFTNYDGLRLTGLTATATFTNPAGTPTDGEEFFLEYKDNGTPRTIAYDTQYRAMGVTLPIITVANKWTKLWCRWDATDTKLDVYYVAQQA